MRHVKRQLAVLPLIVLLFGCGSSLQVTGMQLGRGVNEDETVKNHTTVFKPDETVYVSIQTSGVGSATLGVRWTYGDRVIGEPKEKVSYRDVAATEFHLQSAGGFPPGDYKVEAFLDGQSVGSRTFKVER